MKIEIVILLIVSVVIIEATEEHPPCRVDADCANVVCTKPGQTPECHEEPNGWECHCHDSTECKVDADCFARCGPFAVCENDKHCHGDCTHLG